MMYSVSTATHMDKQIHNKCTPYTLTGKYIHAYANDTEMHKYRQTYIQIHIHTDTHRHANTDTHIWTQIYVRT